MPTQQQRHKNKLYMRSYFAKPKNRSVKRQRDRDRYNYVKQNGKIPKGYELDHSKGYGKGRKQVIPLKSNRSKGAKTTNRKRRGFISK